MNITSPWRRVLLLGCSHGDLADKNALNAVLRFKKAYQPHFTCHLGDFLDTAAFRSGAAGTKDEFTSIEADLAAGLVFIDNLAPQVVLCGNHEARLWGLAKHPKQIVSALAKRLISQIEGEVTKHKAKLIPYEYKAHYQLADFRLMHGTMFGENAARDHAEAYGNVVFAHTHRTAYGRGRRVDNPAGYCVGTLTRVENMEYASARRSTLAWSGGFVWGVHNGKKAHLWLHDNGQEQTWHLPPV